MGLEGSNTDFEKIQFIIILIILIGGIYYVRTETNDYNLLVERYNNLTERYNSLLSKADTLFDITISQKHELERKDHIISVLNESNQWYSSNTVSMDDYKRLGLERDKALYTQRTVVLPEVIKLGNYRLEWLTKCRFDRQPDFSAVMNDNGAEECAGWTDQDRNIYVMNGESVTEEIIICTHEVLHNLIKAPTVEIEENIVEQLEDTVMLKECAELEMKLRG